MKGVCAPGTHARERRAGRGPHRCGPPFFLSGRFPFRYEARAPIAPAYRRFREKSFTVLRNRMKMPAKPPISDNCERFSNRNRASRSRESL